MDDRTYDQARRHVEKFNARLAETRGNKRLSEAGKRETIGEDYAKTRETIAGLKREAAAQVESRRKQLARNLFGLRPGESGSDVIAFRDATDRVSKARTAEALGEIMETASTTGDNVMLRAAASRAHQLGDTIGGGHYRALLGAYVEHVGGSAPSDLEEYTGLTGTAGKSSALVESMATSLPKPRELTDPRVADDTVPSPPQPGDQRSAFG